MVTLQVLATDEGIFLARVAYKNPDGGGVQLTHGNKVMWQGGQEDVEHFASDVAGAVADAICWTVS